MSNSRTKWLTVPEGWGDVFVRTVIAALVAFVALNLKEVVETGEPDIPAGALDGACIALVTFVVYAILAKTLGGARRVEEGAAVSAGR